MNREKAESISSTASPTISSSSSSSLMSYPYSWENLSNKLSKSIEWLAELKEVNYFPFNSLNSPTIFSYKYYAPSCQLFLATKENNLKEIGFKQSLSYSSINKIFNEVKLNQMFSSTRSNSTSSSTSQKAKRENISQNDLTSPSEDENHTQNSTLTDDTAIHKVNGNKNNSTNNILLDKTLSTIEMTNLEPYFIVHKLPRLKNEALISSIEIFKLDSFTIVIILFVLKSKDQSEQFFLHFYSDFETSNLDQVLKCGQEYEIDLMPHRVSAIELVENCSQFRDLNENGISNTFILVNCSHKTNVLFSINLKSKRFEQVVESEKYFVELKPDLAIDNCTSHDYKYVVGSNQSESKIRRINALGFQHGSLSIYMIDAEANVILKSINNEHDSMITQLQFFTSKSNLNWNSLDIDSMPINLLVLRTFEPTRIMNDVFKLEKQQSYDQDLEISHVYDLVTSAVIYDATFSGYNSIVLGTFGKVVLFFCPHLINRDESTESDETGNDSKLRVQLCYELRREISLKHSIMGLSSCKLTSNGALDLVVFTLNGVSVWQYEPERIIDLINIKYEQNETKILDLINSKLLI